MHISLAAVRAKLATKGFTALPLCVRCGRQVQPKHWGTEACKECEAAVRFADERIRAIDCRLTQIWGAGREGKATPAMQDEAENLEIERADLLAPTGDRPPHTSGDGQCLGCRHYKDEWEAGEIDACPTCGHLHPAQDACPVFPPADWGKNA